MAARRSLTPSIWVRVPGPRPDRVRLSTMSLQHEWTCSRPPKRKAVGSTPTEDAAMLSGSAGVDGRLSICVETGSIPVLSATYA